MSLCVAARLQAVVAAVFLACVGPVAASPQVEQLSLQEALDHALRASPKVASSLAGVDAARGTERQSRLFPNPEVNVDAENFSGSGPYGGTGNAELTYGVSQFVELGGKREARQAAASAMRQGAEYEYEASRLDLVRDVTIAYFSVVAAEENLQLARNLEDAARNSLSYVNRRVDAARDPLFQRNRAQSVLSTAIIAREQAENSVRAARRKLGRYWGAPDVNQTLSADSFFDVNSPAALATYEEMLALSPDLIRLERLRSAREAERDLAEAGVIPDLKASVGLKQFPGSRDTALVAGVSLPIPVLNQNQGEISRAGAEVTRALNDHRQVAQEKSQQLIDAWTEWQNAWTEIEALNASALPQAEKAYAQALNGFRAGGFQYLDVLDTQRSLFETKRALNAALLKLQEAKAQVARLTAAAQSNSKEISS